MARAVPLLPSLSSAKPSTISRLDLTLIFAMGLWGSNFVVSKAATDLLPPAAYNAFRFAVATVALFIVMRLHRVDLRLPRKEWLPIAVASFIGYALYQPFFINGLHNTTVGNSVLILTAGPVWVVLFNAWRSQERITRACILGTFVALAGVVAVIVGRYAGQLSVGGANLYGDGLTLIASFLWAASLLSSRGPLARNANAPTTFWLLVGGAVSQIIIGAPSVVELDWKTITLPIIGAILYSGVISVVVGSIIFNHAVVRLGAARASIYSYLQPLTAATLAVLVLHEAFTPWLLVGGVFVFVGVGLVRRT